MLSSLRMRLRSSLTKRVRRFVKLANLLVNQAISEGASDIHIEPVENICASVTVLMES